VSDKPQKSPMQAPNRHFTDYLAVTLRGALPASAEGEVAVFFGAAGGGVLRLRMPIGDARQLASVLARAIANQRHPDDMNVHSDNSSGRPSVDGSTPLEGR
jgi:hypothetical protein